MRTIIKIAFFTMLISYSAAMFGQQKGAFEKDRIDECLSKGDCKDAQIMYNSYKDATGKTDVNIEARIRNCESAQNNQGNTSAWNNTMALARNSYYSKDYATAKKYYSDALALAQTMGSDYIAASRQGIRDCEQKIRERINDILSRVNQTFNSTPPDYEKAFKLYKEAKDLGSNDKTGYNNFMKKVMDLVGHTGYDSFIKDLLLKARDLENTKEVNDLLSNNYR